MRTFYLFFIVICSTLVITSCDNNDEDPEEEIVGRWSITEIRFQDGTSVYPSKDTPDSSVYYFTENGYCGLETNMQTIAALPYHEYEINDYYVLIATYEYQTDEFLEEIVYSYKLENNILELTFFSKVPSYEDEDQKIAKQIMRRIK